MASIFLSNLPFQKIPPKDGAFKNIFTKGENALNLNHLVNSYKRMLTLSPGAPIGPVKPSLPLRPCKAQKKDRNFIMLCVTDY